ncbi:MAG: acyltransferase family protein [Alphaproteobacteria bacterium]
MANRIVSLQILRFFAAFGVVFYHYYNELYLRYGYAENYFSIGASGVDVFFVISGFIISYVAVRDSSASQYFLKRIFRIAPLYWALTFGMFLIALTLPQLLSGTTANMEHLVKSLLFIPFEKEPGIIQPVLFLGWTLNYEMFFYAIMALSIVINRRHAIPLTVALICGFYLGNVILRPDGLMWKFYSNPIILEFVYGALIYLAWERWPHIFEKIRFIWIPGTVILLSQQFWHLGIDRAVDMGIPAAMIVVGILGSRSKDGRLTNFLSTLGDASFSVYLCHPFVLQFFFRIIEPYFKLDLSGHIIASIIICSLVVVPSLMLYRLLEYPSNAFLRNRFLGRTR